MLRQFVQRHASTAASVPDLFDVVVVGGGVAGNAIACALASEKVFSRIALIEPNAQAVERVAPPNPTPGEIPFSNRVVSLTPGSVQWLREIGVWNAVDIRRTCAYQHMRVWDGQSLTRGHISFDSNPQKTGSECMGYIVENANLVGALTRTLQSFPRGRVDAMYGERVTDIRFPGSPSNPDPAHQASSSLEQVYEENEARWKEAMLSGNELAKVSLSNGRTLSTSLVIGADGANSKVRESAGISFSGWNYQQNGLVATVRVSECDNRTAWQRFLPTGPLAMLPLTSTQSSLVWSLPPELAGKLQKTPPEVFAAMVNAGFRLEPVDLEYLFSVLPGREDPPNAETQFLDDVAWRLSVMSGMESDGQVRAIPPVPAVLQVQPESRGSFPLRFRKSSEYVDHRVALIGDAAHLIHPLAGQGLNMGLGDAQELVRVLLDAHRCGQDLGALQTLRAYNQARMAQNLVLMGAIDGLSRAFQWNSSGWTWLRSTGMDVLDRAPWLKHSIMRYAMGN